jgi:hypothetical protein
VDAAWRAGTGKREGGLAAAWDSAGARRGHVARPAEQGRGNGLTGGLRAQCRAAGIQIGFKNSSNGFKFVQILTDPKGVFSCSKNWK